MGEKEFGAGQDSTHSSVSLPAWKTIWTSPGGGIEVFNLLSGADTFVAAIPPPSAIFSLRVRRCIGTG